MTSLPRHLLVGIALVGGSTLAGSPQPPAAASATIQHQIDALLKHRLRPEPLPLDLPNPFVMTGSAVRDNNREKSPVTVEIVATAEPAVNPDRPAIPATSAEVLAACAARLRIGGVIRIKDQIQVVINDSPRKEGDVIAVNWNNAAVQLRVMRLQPDHFLLRFMDAELTLKY